jgi:hypothetical protein
LWDEHGEAVSIDALRPEAHGLLPLLHRRLVALDRRPPTLDRLQGIRRRLWVQNELRLRSTGAAIDTLATGGVAAALTGGAGVLVGALERLDLRPLHDVDVVIGRDDAATAVAVLAGSGWLPGTSWRDGYRLDVEAQRLTDADDRSVVLRWSVSPPYDDGVTRARAVETGAGWFPVVEPADLLVQTLLDGARAVRVASVRWASDALAVLAGEVDWERVASVAAARRAGPTVRAALAQLDRLVPLPAPVPPLPGRRSWWARALGADAAGPPTRLRAAVRR